SAGQTRSWVFLPILNVPPNLDPSKPTGGFVPLRSPALDGHHFAQLFNAAANQHRVVPAPYTNNRTGPTCRHAGLPFAWPPIDERIGFATAPLMNDLPARTVDEKDKILEIMDTLVDPDASHMFNTDCVSCHTETWLGINLLKGNSHIKEDI